MLGAQAGPYLQRDQLELSFGYRYLRSNRHFAGTEEQTIREENENFVINTQNVFDLGITYGVSERLNATLTIPFLAASWAVPSPIGPPFQPDLEVGQRQKQSAGGIGDLSLVGRYWLLSPPENPTRNVSIGLGVKFPTGDYDQTDVYPDLEGNNFARKTVDVSIQPGDGGWGFLMDLQAFQQVRQVTFFLSGLYLANPRNTNGTPSIRSGLRPDLPPDTEGLTHLNSVPDQYLGRLGLATGVPWVEGLGVSLAGRVEGLRQTDVFGDSQGFRRPGYAVSIEPGLSYTWRDVTAVFSVPVAISRNRQPTKAGPVPQEGDATFADYFFLFSMQYRFDPPWKQAERSSTCEGECPVS